MRRMICLMLLLTLAAFAQAETSPSPRPDLSGVWVLDQAASDDLSTLQPPRTRERGGRSGGSSPGGAGGRGGRGGGGGGGFRTPDGEGAPEGDRAAQRGGLESPGKARERLTIFQAGNEFNVTDGNDLSTVFQCDGSDATIWTPRGPRLAQARWDGDVLAVDLRPQEQGRGGAESVTYTLEAERLVVVRSLTPPGADQAIRLRSVYVRGGNSNKEP